MATGDEDVSPSSVRDADVDRIAPEHVHGTVDALHVMGVDLARGGQAETRTICDRLDEPCRRHLAATLFRSPPGNLDPSFRLNVPDGRLRRLGFDPRAARRLRRLVRVHRPRIVVAHGSEALKYAALLPRSVVLVYHKIGTVDDAATRGIRRRFHARLLRRPDIVVAVSNDAAADAADFGRPDAVVVPNCREVTRSAYRPVTAERSPLRTLFVGHLSPSKQPEVYLDVIGQLRRCGVDATGTVVGDGPLISRVRDRAPSDVAVLGRRDDVASLLQDHDVLVFTSRRAGEGMPGVLIEAGLAGRAVVAFEGPGVCDVVIEGVTGFVVPTGDVETMVDRLRSLAGDRRQLRALGAAAHDHCTRTFDAASVAERWRGVLASADRSESGSTIPTDVQRGGMSDDVGA